MRSPSLSTAFRRQHQTGFAIVVVVSLMALLLVMIIAFMLLSGSNRSNSNLDVSIRQADSISKAATATVISDILAEFAADTPPLDASSTDKLQKIYPVTNATSMLPSRTLKSSVIATDPNFKNLVKQSANGRTFAKVTQNGVTSDVGVARASSVSTSTMDIGQRFLTKEIWTTPMLFRNGASLAADQVPDWIYVDRSGGNPGSGGANPFPDAAQSLTSTGAANPKFVIGRYAWQIYDLGGLLDATVALYDPSSTSSGKDAKDSPLWAVATALTGGDAVLGQNLSKALFNWRHLVGKVAGPKPKRLIEDWAEPNGWTKVFTDGTNTDQTFLTRQDLIKFQRQNPTQFPPNLLAWFTHSNYALNQAALRPDPARPKVLALASGGNDGTGNDDAINPSFLEIRSAIPGQTSATKPTVPVAAKRFPLDRLDLVVTPPSEPALVQKYFGLDYSSGQWTYPGNTIKRLVEVAALNREPNLFELIKATLHVGSLGGSGIGTSSAKALDQSVNYHVVQIVANLIDQWDADSFPTIINFDGRQFIGIEDLPRIYYVRTGCFRQKIIDPATFVGSKAGPPPASFKNIYESVYLRQPILWNPHAESSVSVSKPTDFRIIAISNQASGSTAADVKCQVYLPQAPVWNSFPSGPINDFRNANGPNFSVTPGLQKWDASSAFITFNVTSSGPASFRQPYPLKSPNYPAGSNAAGKEIFPLLSDTELGCLDAASKSNQAIGFLVGKVWTSDTVLALDPGLVIENGIRYELQYSSNGNWITYDVMKTEPFTGQDRTSFTPADRRHFASFFRIDPRTSRLGNFITNNFRGWNPASTPNQWFWNNGQTGAPDDTAPAMNGTEQFIGTFPTPPTGWTLRNDPNTLVPAVYPRYFQANISGGGGSYADADSVTRPAMGASASGVNGLPLANPPADAVSRPRILNRAFRSIAELGYVFRDSPWRQMDLSHTASEDGKLLDVFCLHSDPTTHEAPRISRGRVNLNSAPTEVLAALFEGTSKAVTGATPFTSAESLSLGKALNDWVASVTPGGLPLRQRSDLIGRTVSGPSASFTSTGFMSQVDAILSANDKPIGERREAVVRALADSSDTRTWNLMIERDSTGRRILDMHYG